MHRVHYYDTSAAAYEACLGESPCIVEGDVLAVISEGVIGLASSDPLAVTIDAGALRSLQPMSSAAILRETVHNADQWRHAVELALAHHLPIAPHFLPFALRCVPLSPSQTVVALTLDDVMMAIDAIRHRETQLTKRAALIDAESSHGLFLASALRKLATARRHLERHPPATIPEHPCGPP